MVVEEKEPGLNPQKVKKSKMQKLTNYKWRIYKKILEQKKDINNNENNKSKQNISKK